MAPRQLLSDSVTGRFYRQEQVAELDSEIAGRLDPRSVSEHEYYSHGSPLTYSGLLGVLASTGLDSLEGRKLLDFGYGSIGHLRLLAMMGAKVQGIEVSPFREALYGPEDMGAVGRHEGSLALHHGYFPADAELVKAVGTGFDLVVSQNVLKQSLMSTDFAAEPPVDLGVSHDEFASAFFALVMPGALVVLYNFDYSEKGAQGTMCGVGAAAWERAGFELLAFDKDDSHAFHRLATHLLWTEASRGKPGMDLDLLHARFSVLRRPG